MQKYFLFILLFISVQLFAEETKIQSEPNSSVVSDNIQTQIIREIDIEGLVKIEKNKVLNAIKSKIGEVLNIDTIKTDQQAIYDLGFFSEDVQVETENIKDGIKLIFKVKENPIVSEIQFIGNRKFKSKLLKKSITQKENEHLNTQNYYKIKDIIIDRYRLEGYNNVSVNFETSKISEDKVKLIIKIDEGERILIKDISIKGNKTYSSVRLKLLLENMGTWLIIKNYFDGDAFEDDLEKIKSFYKGKGFLDIEVKKGDFIYNEDKGWVIPVIIITEGKRYKIRKIEPQNYSIFNREEILRNFKNLENSNFNAKRLAKSIEKLYQMYGNEGYIDFNCKFDYTKVPDTNFLDIDLMMDEQSRIYVGAIKIKKQKVEYDDLNFFEKFYIKISPPVKEDVIKKQVTLKPGDVYRSYKEVKTIQNLNNLGFLSDVAIDRGLADEEDVRDVIVNYKEEDAGRVMLSVGYGELDGFFIAGEYDEPNIFGDANRFNIQGKLGTQHKQISVNYFDRYFRSSKDSLEYSAYYDEYYFSYLTDKILGGSVEYGHPISDYVSLYIRQRLEYVQFDDVDEDVKDKPEDYGVVATRFRVAEDRRDNIRWPTKGYYQSAGIEAGYADGLLAKFTGRYSHYWNFYRSLIFASNTELGLMPYNSEEVGYNERFFLGGADDMRGFAPRRAGPTDSGESSMPKGGSTKFLFQNELRFPIIEPFKGVIFLDTGMLEDRFFEIGSPRMSTGFGLRLDMKRFYVHIDLAKALIKKKNDKTQLFHFRIGSKF